MHDLRDPVPLCKEYQLKLVIMLSTNEEIRPLKGAGSASHKAATPWNPSLLLSPTHISILVYSVGCGRTQLRVEYHAAV